MSGDKKSDKAKVAKTETLSAYEGTKKHKVLKDVGAVKKGEEVEITFERALHWQSKGII